MWNEAPRAGPPCVKALIGSGKKTAAESPGFSPQLNPFWKQPEWNAMIAHQIQLLTTIAQGTLEGQYAVFTTTAPLCQRLAVEMACLLYTSDAADE